MQITPIIVSPDLIKPVNTGVKTETRRLNGLDYINRDPEAFTFLGFEEREFGLRATFASNATHEVHAIKSPYGTGNDQLWVRENWYVGKGYDGVKPSDLPIPGTASIKIGYPADGPKSDWAGKTRPSIFLPQHFSRTTLRITEVMVQRLHDITELDAKNEGAKKGIFREGPNVEKGEFQLEINNMASYVDGFKFIWITINGRNSWDSNPWVWVIKFVKVA